MWSSRPQRVDAGREVPARTELEPVVVHPDGAIEIRYRIATAGPVDLAVFDIRGRRVASLAGGDAVPWRYVHVWDGRAVRAGAVARGVYFVRLDAGGTAVSRKLVRSGR